METLTNKKRCVQDMLQNNFQESNTSIEHFTAFQSNSSNNTETHNKKKSPKMFECKICKRQYSNIGGIVTHQKNAHGTYDPQTIQKTIHNKTKEGLGRPMQFKIDQQQKNQTIDKFLESVESGYTDKRLEFFLDRNLKFVFNSIMEAGDPITHKTKNNLFITDFKDFELNDDTWLSFGTKKNTNLTLKDQKLQQFIQNTLNTNPIIFQNEPVKQIAQCDFFQDDLSCPLTASDDISSNNSSNNNNVENIFFPQNDITNDQENNIINKNCITQKQVTQYKQRCQEFLKKLLEFQKEDQVDWLIQIFEIVYVNIVQYNMQYNQINAKVREQVQINQLSNQTYSTLINNTVHGIISYIKQSPNYLYNSYFGYNN